MLKVSSFGGWCKGVVATRRNPRLNLNSGVSDPARAATDYAETLHNDEGVCLPDAVRTAATAYQVPPTEIRARLAARSDG